MPASRITMDWPSKVHACTSHRCRLHEQLSPREPFEVEWPPWQTCCHVDVETPRKKENGKRRFSVSVRFDSVEPESGPCHPNPERLDSRCHQNLPVVQSFNRPISEATPQTCMESVCLHSQRLSTLNSRLSMKYACSISGWVCWICSSWKWTNSGLNNCVTRHCIILQEYKNMAMQLYTFPSCPYDTSDTRTSVKRSFPHVQTTWNWSTVIATLVAMVATWRTLPRSIFSAVIRYYNYVTLHLILFVSCSLMKFIEILPSYFFLEPHPRRYEFNEKYPSIFNNISINLTGLVALARPKHRLLHFISRSFGWCNQQLAIPICTVQTQDSLKASNWIAQTKLWNWDPLCEAKLIQPSWPDLNHIVGLRQRMELHLCRWKKKRWETCQTEWAGEIPDESL